MKRTEEAEKYFIAGDNASDRRNFKKAIFYFKKASSLGHFGAMNNLAGYYSVGLGVRKDLNKAISLYRKVFNGGETWVSVNIALCYIQKGNSNRAEFWLKKCDLTQDGSAALQLAKLYLEGWNQPRYQQAKKYLKLAVKHRSKKEIAPLELAEAENLLKKLKSERK